MGCDYKYCSRCECVFYYDRIKGYCNCGASFCCYCHNDHIGDFDYVEDDSDTDRIISCPICKDEQLNRKRIDLLKQIKKICDESEFDDEQHNLVKNNEKLKSQIIELNNNNNEQQEKYIKLENELKKLKDTINNLLN